MRLVNRKLFMWWLMCDYSQFCSAKSASKFFFFFFNKKVGEKNCDKTDKSQHTLVYLNQMKASIFIQLLDLYFAGFSIFFQSVYKHSQMSGGGKREYKEGLFSSSGMS